MSERVFILGEWQIKKFMESDLELDMDIVDTGMGEGIQIEIEIEKNTGNRH